MKAQISNEVLGAAAALVAVAPAGWQVELQENKRCTFDEEWDHDGHMFVRFTRGDVQVVLNLAPVGTGRFDAFDRERSWCGVKVEGDTLVDGGSYIRRGIDCSCCTLVSDAKLVNEASHEYGSLQALLDGQLARTERTKAKRATAVAVPGLPFTVQPDWFTKSAATLASGGTVRLTPHGMGTGYAIQRGPADVRRGWRRADVALEQELAVAPLRISTMDCD